MQRDIHYTPQKNKKKNNSTKHMTIYNEVRNSMKGKNVETATSSNQPNNTPTTNQPNNTPTSELQQKVSIEKTFNTLI
jgi:hypothetical protein